MAAGSAGSIRRAAARWKVTTAASCWCRNANCSWCAWTATIVGSAHLVKPPRNNEAQAFAAQLMHAFVAPYARGHGLARMLTEGVEDRARELGYHVLNLDVRETQAAAIHMYDRLASSVGARIRLRDGARQDRAGVLLLQAAAASVRTRPAE